MAKKKKSNKKNTQLNNIDIRVNEFGEIVSNWSIEQLNEFLNNNEVKHNSGLKTEEEE